MNFLYLILCILLGYLLGSIPFALVIGKVFYKTDIRQYGSGNLGGTKEEMPEFPLLPVIF